MGRHWQPSTDAAAGGCMAISLSLNVNGKPVSNEAEPRMLLVQLLRERLHLTGTHVGCDTGQCGACTVHLDGRAVKSCTLLALQAQGADVTTIEGVAPAGGGLHPMQAAFREHHGLQCGFCTPGMVMNAIDLVRSQPNLTEADVRNGLDGNLCRCTGYHNIVKAVLSGASAMKGKS
jgi:aerobic carbon-monoxide dehydrogenase small subunit